MSEKTVFISYRRDSLGKLFARSLKNSLEHNGYDVFLDVDCIDAGAWANQILSQVPKRAHFLLLLTPGALDRCHDPDDWVRREFELAQKHGRNIVPVREESVDLAELAGNCPESMRAVSALQAADLRHGSFEADVARLMQRYIAPHLAPKAEPVGAPAPIKVDISRIDKYAPPRLIGREQELAMLNDAWTKAQNEEPNRPHILTFIALGGEGKTALVANWATDLAYRDWPGCEAAFAWSFYSQGTREQAAASSDIFLKEALLFFGDEEMAISPSACARATPRGFAPRTGGSSNTCASPRRKATSQASKTCNRSTRPWPMAAGLGCSRRHAPRFTVIASCAGLEAVASIAGKNSARSVPTWGPLPASSKPHGNASHPRSAKPTNLGC